MRIIGANGLSAGILKDKEVYESVTGEKWTGTKMQNAGSLGRCDETGMEVYRL